MNENKELDIVKEVAKEVANDIYADGGKPVVQPTGELIGLVPRAIKAALLPLEKWVLQREYNVAEIKKLLEEKLQNTPAELIEPPAPHIAVPAMQYISYSMDNEELRDMYANLLANSMNKIVKNGVHPGFVEIIKQLSPDEAKILKYMHTNSSIPTITLRYVNKEGGGVDIVKNFSNIGEITKCEMPDNAAMYFNNMVRLGLLYDADGMFSFTDKTRYDPLKNHPQITHYAQDDIAKARGFDKFEFTESVIKLSEYGRKFCDICITPENIFHVVVTND